MSKRSITTHLRYAFDKSMAAGAVALIGWLFVISLLMVGVAASVVALIGIGPAGDEPMDFFEAFWASLMRTLDPGTMGDDQGWGFRLVMLAVTLTGIFIVSALIGVISNGISERLELLRKGRSVVLERNHTIIFNWSETIFDVIAQLAMANESRRRPAIVIMADRDKVQMEDEIAAKVPDLRNTRVICRRGDPTDPFDIGIANPQTCRSVIILSPQRPDADAAVIKTMLGLVTDPKRRQKRHRIAVELRDPASAEVARAVGGSEIQIVRAEDLIAKIIVRSTRQPGLSVVYTELLDFEGCEVYAVQLPQLLGLTYGEALFRFDTCCLIGIADEAGKVTLNPPMDQAIEASQKLLVIAEDDSRIRTASAPQVEPRTERRSMPPSRKAERTLLIGWNRRAAQIIRDLSHFVGAGSLVTIAADTPTIEKDVERLQVGRDTMSIELKRVDTSRREDIAGLDPSSYDDILILGYTDELGPQVADTRTLITLFYLRSLIAADSAAEVVSEINEVRNVALAELSNVDDFVVSNKLVGLILSQSSETEYFEQIFEDLLNEEGSEIAMRPASLYVAPGEDVTFYDVLAEAQARGETAFGHFLAADNASDGRGSAVINPDKSARLRYSDTDRVIVLAND